MVDIDYGIPLDIRDAALKMAGVENPYALESQSRNAEVKAIIADKIESRSKNLNLPTNAEKREKAKAILETLAAKLANSTARRPKQRELEVSNKELSKVISKLPFGGTLETPEDVSVKSFFVFGFSLNTPQYTVTSVFEKFGPLALVKIVHQARCGYVSFAKRSFAEECAEYLKSQDNSKNQKTAALLLLDKKEPVRVCWGSPKHLGNSKEEQNKIAIVVNKVMKQLADKDSTQGRGGSKNNSTKKNTDSNKARSTPVPNTKKAYKSMSQDFEI